MLHVLQKKYSVAKMSNTDCSVRVGDYVLLEFCYEILAGAMYFLPLPPSPSLKLLITLLKTL